MTTRQDAAQLGVIMSLNVSTLALLSALVPAAAAAQSLPSPDAPVSNAAIVAAPQAPNVPRPAQQAADEVDQAVRRFRIGVEAGVGFDPELIMFGAHGAFAPIFHRG